MRPDESTVAQNWQAVALWSTPSSSGILGRMGLDDHMFYFYGPTWWNVCRSTDGVNWVPDYVAPEVDRRWWDRNSWGSLAISAGGTKIATTFADRVYMSTDLGATWNVSAQPASNGISKSCLAMSADGQTILVGEWPGRLRLSRDGGATWAEQQPAGGADQYWQCAAMSGDGGVMIAGAWDGRLYKWTLGSGWAETQPAGDVDQYWESVSISSNHRTVIATDGEWVYLLCVPEGDANLDGSVDVIDLLLLVDAWGAVTGDANYDAACDFNGDGSVDVIDLLTLIPSFGQDPVAWKGLDPSDPSTWASTNSLLPAPGEPMSARSSERFSTQSTDNTGMDVYQALESVGLLNVYLDYIAEHPEAAP